MPTAFVAEYGSGKPIIGLLAEYDVLPDMSQAASPAKGINNKQKAAAGHACGHHLFGTGSMAAAIHVKNWLKQTGTSGTIRLYGTPAEEGGGGKVYMVRAGLFDDAEAVILNMKLYWAIENRLWIIGKGRSSKHFQNFILS